MALLMKNANRVKKSPASCDAGLLIQSIRTDRNVHPTIASLLLPLLRFSCFRFFNCGLSGSQTSNRNTIRTTAHVVQTELVAELHAVRVTAVFAANSELNVRTCLTTFLDGHLHQLTNANLIQSRERVLLEDLVLGVRQQEVAHVVAADA